MNPQNNEASQGMQLPAPMEQAPANLPPEALPQGVEQAANQAMESAPTQNTPATAAPSFQLPVPPAPAAPPAQSAVANTTANDALVAADDNDLIEKEWVNKAKQIVERTRDDPYKQSEELTVVKVDYMKKRYNKTLKLNK